MPHSQQSSSSAGSKAPADRAPLVVSNHVSLVDAIWFFYKDQPSFVAKVQTVRVIVVSCCSPSSLLMFGQSDVARYPVIGLVVSALQCVLVDRQSGQSRHDAAQAIQT